MRALLCVEPGKLEIVERPRPVPGPGEALMRIRRAGVCGTDFHIFEGSHPFLAYPRVIGHELSGEITQAAQGGALKEGAQVSVIPYLSCGACVACRRGKPNSCQRIAVLGVHTDGGMADYVCVPEANLVAAEGLSPDAAAMAEFLAIGAHAVRRSGLREGDRVLVVGAGPIGLGCALFAGIAGASVTALDRRTDRLAFASAALGLAHTVVADAQAPERLKALTDGDLFDVVIDATGVAPSIEAGFNHVAHGGTYVLVSVVRETISFPDPLFHAREISLLGSRNATREDFLTVLAALRAGRVPTAKLATHRAPLDEAPARFPEWLRPESGAVKALLDIGA